VVGAIVLTQIFFLTSCKSHRNQTDILRMNIETEPESLDWSIATENWSIHVINNIMEGMARYDDDLKVMPALASSWDVSDDSLKYTFHLRKNVKWTDGAPLVARHFVDSWKRLLDPATAAEYAYFLYDIKGAEDFNSGKIKNFSDVGVKALDDYTLEVTLKNPVVYFPYLVTFVSTFPIRLDVIEKWGDNWTEPGHIVTLGAYKLESWRHEYSLTVVRNEGYYGKAPPIGKVEMFMVNEENTALDLYDTGFLDIIRVPMHAIPYYRSRPDYVEGPAFWMYYLGFNVSKPPFDNPLVRRAFAHAVDRDEVVKVLRGGRAPWSSWIPPRMAGENPDIGCRFDPGLARKLLEQAGYESGGKFPEVTLGFNTLLQHTIIASNVQEQWRANLGVNVRLDNMEWKVYLQKVRDDPPQIFRMGWVADYPDPDSFMKVFISSSGNNFTGWKSPVYDRLVYLASRERDAGKRQELYDKAQRLLLEEDCVIIPVFVSQINRLVSPRIKGFKVNPMDLIFLERLSFRDGGAEGR